MGRIETQIPTQNPKLPKTPKPKTIQNPKSKPQNPKVLGEIWYWYMPTHPTLNFFAFFSLYRRCFANECRHFHYSRGRYHKQIFFNLTFQHTSRVSCFTRYIVGTQRGQKTNQQTNGANWFL